MIYLMKCGICGHEDSIDKPMTDNMPTICTNPVRCPGIMNNISWKVSPPYLDKAAVPTRNVSKDTKYTTK